MSGDPRDWYIAGRDGLSLEGTRRKFRLSWVEFTKAREDVDLMDAYHAGSNEGLEAVRSVIRRIALDPSEQTRDKINAARVLIQTSRSIEIERENRKAKQQRKTHEELIDSIREKLQSTTLPVDVQRDLTNRLTPQETPQDIAEQLNLGSNDAATD